MNIKATDLVGKEQHGFMVLDFKRENKRTYLYVVCPFCNSKSWIRMDMISRYKSCGCQAGSTQYEMENLTGKHFGRLKAVKPTELRDKSNGSVLWECKCECGNTKLVSAGNLTKGVVSSCG